MSHSSSCLRSQARTEATPTFQGHRELSLLHQLLSTGSNADLHTCAKPPGDNYGTIWTTSRKRLRVSKGRREDRYSCRRAGAGMEYASLDFLRDPRTTVNLSGLLMNNFAISQLQWQTLFLQQDYDTELYGLLFLMKLLTQFSPLFFNTIIILIMIIALMVLCVSLLCHFCGCLHLFIHSLNDSFILLCSMIGGERQAENFLPLEVSLLGKMCT